MVIHIFDGNYPLCGAAPVPIHTCWNGRTWPVLEDCKPNCPGCNNPICPLCYSIWSDLNPPPKTWREKLRKLAVVGR